MCVAWLLAALASAATVDRVVAVVGDPAQEVVTASDVALEGALVAIGVDRLAGSAAPFWSPEHGDPLERLVDATMIRIAAADVALYQPSPDAVRERVAALHASMPTEEAWRAFLDRWGLDEGELASVLRRRMIVERFLARNLKSDPSDAAAWMEELHAALAALAERVPVRMVPAEGP